MKLRRALSTLTASGPLVVVIACLTAVAASPAAAETVDLTSQAGDADAGFLVATPQSAPAAVCLVDTGVNNTTPDTSNVVDRLALVGPADDMSPSLHGTSMAMFMAAARNGYGMVGLWPAARIVSVRASAAGEDAFTTAGFINGVKRCDAIASAYGIRVIELALSSSSPLAAEDADALTDAIARARADGILVVAAAGNTNGGPLGVPASLPGVLSVGAVGSGGTLCSFSSIGAHLLAPGCSLDGADPSTGTPSRTMQGTSEASALVAAAAAALLSYRPELTPDEAVTTLTSSAANVAAGPRLSVSAAFRTVGLDDVVDRGSALAPVAPASAPIVAEPALPDLTMKPRRRLPAPHITIAVHRGLHRVRLTIAVSNRPRGAVLHIRVFEPARAEFTRAAVTRTTRRTRVIVRAIGWTRVSAQFVDPSARRASSPTTTVRSAKLRAR